MSVEIGSTTLTGIQNPVVGARIERKLEDFTLDQIMSSMTPPKEFMSFRQQGVKFDHDRAKDLSAKGADINADWFSFDKGSFFLEMDGQRGKEKFYVINAREGLLVASERDGAGFISSDDSISWSIDDEDFEDIEKVLRGEFDLSNRTHTLQGNEFFQVPSYSSILEEDGDLPLETRQTILEIGDQEHLLYREELENGVGLWTDGEYAFKGRDERNIVTVENFQELEYSIDLNKIDPQNPHLDITDLDKYRDVDFDFFTESILEMATEEDEGLVKDWDWKRDQNVLAYKKNSSDSTMQVLGIGNHNLEFTEGMKEAIEDVLHSGNDVDDLLARLGRIVENPLRDDRFQGHELGYWKLADDLRLYTVTPEFDNTTYLAFAGTHQQVKHLYDTNNPSEIKERILDQYVDLSQVVSDHGWAANHGYLPDLLQESGHSEENAYAAWEFIADKLPRADIAPSPTEFYKLGTVRTQDYDRIDLDIDKSLEEIQEYTDDELLDSLDTESVYNEVHIDEDLSVNLRFRDEEESPSIEL